jgi:nucleoside-diphosphate-sugar epimerase
MAVLKDKTVIVTGAAGGIGRAIAEEAGRAGARLALVDADARVWTRRPRRSEPMAPRFCPAWWIWPIMHYGRRASMTSRLISAGST